MSITIIIVGLYAVLSLWILRFIVEFRYQFSYMVGMMAAMTQGMSIGLGIGSLFAVWLPGEFFH